MDVVLHNLCFVATFTYLLVLQVLGCVKFGGVVLASELCRFHRSLFCKLEHQDMYYVHVMSLDLLMLISYPRHS